jgi:hypothetical protein
MKHAVVTGVVAGLTAALVLMLAWLVIFLAVGRGSSHGVELGPDDQPTYTVP